MDWFESFALRGGESRECGLDGFLDSWHATDLMESVLRKLVTTHYPGMLKNLKRTGESIFSHRNTTITNTTRLQVAVLLFTLFEHFRTRGGTWFSRARKSRFQIDIEWHSAHRADQFASLISLGILRWSPFYLLTKPNIDWRKWNPVTCFAVRRSLGFTWSICLTKSWEKKSSAETIRKKKTQNKRETLQKIPK